MRKKIFSIMLSLALVVTMMPMQYVDAATTVKTKATVSTQKGLNKALTNKSLRTLTIKSTKDRDFTIPKGTHNKLKLVLNTTKSDIKNYAKFKSVTVEKIGKNTWTEYAKENSIDVKASTANLVVTEKASLKQVSVNKTESKLSLEANGPVQKLEVLKKSEISITGSVSKTEEMKLNVLSNAEESTVVCSIRAKVSVETTATIVLEKGSERSIVETLTEQIVKVINNAETRATVTDFKGNESTVSSGGESNVNKPAEPSPSVSGGGGGGTPTPTPTPQASAESKHIVSFVGGKGGIKAVTHGGQITSADASAKEKDKTGYEFAGWFTDDDYTTPAVFPVTIIDDETTFYAKYNPITYTIYFHKNQADTSLDKKQVCEYDETYNLLPNSYVMTGMNFLGWSTVSDDANTVIEYANTTSVRNLKSVSGEAVHLYAKWADKESEVDPSVVLFTIDLNLNGYGSIGKSSFKVSSGEAYGSTLNESQYIPTATGYIFGGWYDNQECTGSKVETTDKPTSSKTLYAKWTPITYTVNYHPNGASDNPEMTPSTFTYDTGAYLKTNKFELFGYEFAGWSLSEATGSAIAYANNSFVLNLKSTSGDAVDLYAQWVEKQYDNVRIQYISGNTGKGTVTNAVDEIHPLKGTPAGSRAIPAEGCEFVGWFCNGVSCDSGEALVPEKVNGEYKEAVYTAKFKGKSYTIHYDINNVNSYQALSADAMEDQVLEYGDIANLNKNQFKLVNCDMAFVGWNTQPDGSGDFYADEEQVKNLSNDGGDITLYAQWHHPVGGRMIMNNPDSGATLGDENFVRCMNFYNENGELINTEDYNIGHQYSPELLNEVAYYDITNNQNLDSYCVKIVATVDGLPSGEILSKKLQYGGFGSTFNEGMDGFPMDDTYYHNCECGDCPEEVLCDDTAWSWARKQNQNELNGCSDWTIPRNISSSQLPNAGLASGLYWDTVLLDLGSNPPECYAFVYNTATKGTKKYVKHNNAYAILTRKLPGAQDYVTYYSNDDRNITSRLVWDGQLPSADTFEALDPRTTFVGWVLSGDASCTIHHPGDWCNSNEEYKAIWGYTFGGKLVKKQDYTNLEYEKNNWKTNPDWDFCGVFDANGNDIFRSYMDGQISTDQLGEQAVSFGYYGDNTNAYQDKINSICMALGFGFYIVATEDGTATSDILVGKNLEFGGSGDARVNVPYSYEDIKNSPDSYSKLYVDSNGGTNTIWNWLEDCRSSNPYEEWTVANDEFKCFVCDMEGFYNQAGIDEPLWISMNAQTPHASEALNNQFAAGISDNAVETGKITALNDEIMGGNKGIKSMWIMCFDSFKNMAQHNITEDNINQVIAKYNEIMAQGLSTVAMYGQIPAGTEWDDANAATERLMSIFPDSLRNSTDPEIREELDGLATETTRILNEGKFGAGWPGEVQAFGTVVDRYLNFARSEIEALVPQKIVTYTPANANGTQSKEEKGSVIAYRNFNQQDYMKGFSVTIVANNGTDEEILCTSKGEVARFRDNMTNRILFDSVAENDVFIGWSFTPDGDIETTQGEVFLNQYNEWRNSHPGWDGKLYAHWATGMGGRVAYINKSLDPNTIAKYYNKYEFYNMNGDKITGWVDLLNDHGSYSINGWNEWEANNIYAYRVKDDSIDINLNEGDLFYIAAIGEYDDFVRESATCGNIGSMVESLGTDGFYKTLDAIARGAATSSDSIWDIVNQWNSEKLNGYDDWFIGNLEEMQYFFTYNGQSPCWTSEKSGDKLQVVTGPESSELQNTGEFNVIPLRPFEEADVHRVYYTGELSSLGMARAGLSDIATLHDGNGFEPGGYTLSKYSTKPDGSGRAYMPGYRTIRENAILYPQWVVK